MRVRKQLITNLRIKDKDIQRLSNGYVVYKRANNHAHALIPIQKAQAEAKAKILLKKIEYHKKALEKLGIKGVIPPIPKLGKRPYVKKNTEFWSNGGNLKDVIAKQRGGDLNQRNLHKISSNKEPVHV